MKQAQAACSILLYHACIDCLRSMIPSGQGSLRRIRLSRDPSKINDPNDCLEKGGRFDPFTGFLDPIKIHTNSEVDVISRPSRVTQSRLHNCSVFIGSVMSHDSVYVVVVSGKLKPGQMSQFIENFKPLAKHVAENEEGTLTYQFSTGGDDPDRLCIYERSVFSMQPHATSLMPHHLRVQV